MKILQIVDSPWAIGALAKGIRKYNPQIDWKLATVPPRSIDDHIEEVREKAKDVDIIDFQYWNVAWQLIEKIPELKKKKLMLTHHNQKNILSKDWSDFDMLLCKTDYSYNKLNEEYPGRVRKIENMIPFDEFEWNKDYPPKEPTVGYVGRICPWKGLKEIAKACYELGYSLSIMGKQDKVKYWNEIPDEYKKIMKFDFMDCNDDERIDYYKSLTIYVGNSVDHRESGTLPFLEAMATGVPVVTTPNGMAADIVQDEKDALLVDFENYNDLKEKIKRAMEDKELRMKLRKNAWGVIKNYPYQRMAKDYERAYADILFSNKLIVSVVIPATVKRIEEVKQIIKSLESSSYEYIEAIVAWDEDFKKGKLPLSNEEFNIVVKEVYTGNTKEEYGLAKARNLAIIESIGKVIVFCDSRLKPEPNAIAKFAEAVFTTLDKKWVFGNKGGVGKKSFVENFSAIRREYIIKAGMFNERISDYGGASQELRTRFQWQGFELVYLPEVMATEIKSSKITPQRRKDIIKMKNLLYKLYK